MEEDFPFWLKSKQGTFVCAWKQTEKWWCWRGDPTESISDLRTRQIPVFLNIQWFR